MYEISAVKLENSGNNVIGLASLIVDGKMTFNNIRLVSYKDKEGFYLSMPRFKNASGEYENYFHPISREMVDLMQDAAAKALKSGKKEMFYTQYEGEEVFHIAVDARTTFSDAKVRMRIGDEFVCNSISVRPKKDGASYFVAMPSYKKKDGTYENVCYPITADFHKELSGHILDKYKTAGSKQMAGEKSEDVRTKADVKEAVKEAVKDADLQEKKQTAKPRTRKQGKKV